MRKRFWLHECNLEDGEKLSVGRTADSMAHLLRNESAQSLANDSTGQMHPEFVWPQSHTKVFTLLKTCLKQQKRICNTDHICLQFSHTEKVCNPPNKHTEMEMSFSKPHWRYSDWVATGTCIFAKSTKSPVRLTWLRGTRIKRIVYLLSSVIVSYRTLMARVGHLSQYRARKGIL